MNLNADVRRRLNLPPRRRGRYYDLVAPFIAGAAVGLFWTLVYLVRVGAM